MLARVSPRLTPAIDRSSTIVRVIVTASPLPAAGQAGATAPMTMPPACFLLHMRWILRGADARSSAGDSDQEHAMLAGHGPEPSAKRDRLPVGMPPQVDRVHERSHQRQAERI